MAPKAHHESDAPSAPEATDLCVAIYHSKREAPVGVPGLLYSRMENCLRLATTEKFCRDPAAPEGWQSTELSLSLLLVAEPNLPTILLE